MHGHCSVTIDVPLCTVQAEQQLMLEADNMQGQLSDDAQRTRSCGQYGVANELH